MTKAPEQIITDVQNKVDVKNEQQLPALVVKMADAADMLPNQYFNTVKATCGLASANYAQVMAFLLTARKYGLDPMVKQIYAFEKGGKIVPIVPIDGWLKIINDHPEFDGVEFADTFDGDKKIIAISCKLHRKDRKFPVIVTEYLSECDMKTEPWKKWPIRMLRHKAAIQAARYAFGLAGIYDPDEGERISIAQTPEEISAAVESHMADIGDIGAASSADYTEKPLPPEEEPSDWESVFDELAMGVQTTKNPIDLKVFMEENAESIDKMGKNAAPAILKKWLGVMDTQNKKFAAKKA